MIRSTMMFTPKLLYIQRSPSDGSEAWLKWKMFESSAVLKANRRKLLFIVQTDGSIRKLMFGDQLSSLLTNILRVTWRKHCHVPINDGSSLKSAEKNRRFDMFVWGVWCTCEGTRRWRVWICACGNSFCVRWIAGLQFCFIIAVKQSDGWMKCKFI